MRSCTLVLGGMRSGKSGFAEGLAQQSHLGVIYVATAECLDEEMRARVAIHRARRGEAWRTIEESLDLVATIARENAPDRALLVDCLSMWVTNLLLAKRDISLERQRLRQALNDAKGTVILVSSETSLGILPTNALARRFLDECGLVHQVVADVADNVALVVAGLPTWLKRQAALPV